MRPTREEYFQQMSSDSRSTFPGFMNTWWWNLSFGLLGIWVFAIPTFHEVRGSDPSTVGVVLGCLLTLSAFMCLATGIAEIVRRFH
jgi:hypothetical protein